ncbi:MAG: FecR family protein [Thalassotalea sp.]
MNKTIKGFTNKTIINQEAAQWVLLLEDTPKLSQKQIEELNTWVSTSDVHRECLESMAKSWGEMDLLSRVMLPLEMKKPSFISVLFAGLLFPFCTLYHWFLACLRPGKKIFNTVLIPSLSFSAVLAVIFILLPLDNSKDLVFHTKMGEHKSYTMADGSILWLNSSTTIHVDYTEAFRRIKLIQGEAHFEVAKDATRPFEVYANDRLVRAIGTAFSVHKLKDTIQVIVSEGTVELAIIDETLVVIPDDFQPVKVTDDFNKVNAKKSLHSASNKTATPPTNIKQILGRLSAGQRISIPIENENISDVVELDNSEITRSLSWKEGKLVFAGESLEDVIQEITRHTKVKIDVLDPQLKSMRIGGQFQLGETDTLFYVLESGFGITVNKVDELHVQLLLKEK